MFTVKIVFMKWFYPWLGWFQASEQYSHTFWKLSWFLAFAFLHVSCVILDVSFKIFLIIVLSEIVHSILTEWFQWSQGSVVLTWYIVTWKEEVLLVCFVSLPTICPCKAGLQVVWGFAAAATCNFQGSGVPAQPMIRWYVNSASFFISPSMFWKKHIWWPIHWLLQHAVQDLIKGLDLSTSHSLAMLEQMWYAVSSR